MIRYTVYYWKDIHHRAAEEYTTHAEAHNNQAFLRDHMHCLTYIHIDEVPRETEIHLAREVSDEEFYFVLKAYAETKNPC